jgi:hypothetical protein
MTVHTNKQRYAQLFITPIENCGLRSCHELVISTIMITTVGAVKILHKEKNTAAGGWGTMLIVKCVLFFYVRVCIFCIVGGDPLGCSY